MRLAATLLLLSPAATAAEPRRPSPGTVRAWQDRKFGMFIHFGIYSVLGGVWKGQLVTRGYIEQIQAQGNLPRDEYERVALQCKQADPFYNYNGHGYYERPSVNKLQWNFTPPHPFRKGDRLPAAVESVILTPEN